MHSFNTDLSLMKSNNSYCIEYVLLYRRPLRQIRQEAASLPAYIWSVFGLDSEAHTPSVHKVNDLSPSLTLQKESV